MFSTKIVQIHEFYLKKGQKSPYIKCDYNAFYYYTIFFEFVNRFFEKNEKNSKKTFSRASG